MESLEFQAKPDFSLGLSLSLYLWLAIWVPPLIRQVDLAPDEIGSSNSSCSLSYSRSIPNLIRFAEAQVLIPLSMRILFVVALSCYFELESRISELEATKIRA